jgi:hypothetical protein
MVGLARKRCGITVDIAKIVFRVMDVYSSEDHCTVCSQALRHGSHVRNLWLAELSEAATVSRDLRNLFVLRAQLYARLSEGSLVLPESATRSAGPTRKPHHWIL